MSCGRASCHARCMRNRSASVCLGLCLFASSIAACGGQAPSGGANDQSGVVISGGGAEDGNARPPGSVPSESGATAPAVPPAMSAPSPPPPVAKVAPDWAASCPAAPTDAWVAAAPPDLSGTIADLKAYQDAVRAAVVGHWTGQYDVSGEKQSVMISLEASGHYTGMCFGPTCGAWVYNGSDFPSPLAQYRLDAMSLDGVSSGSVDMVFGPQAAFGEKPTDPPYVPVAGTNLLQKVVLDASGNRLRFFLVSYLDTPVMTAYYDLWRCP